MEQKRHNESIWRRRRQEKRFKYYGRQVYNPWVPTMDAEPVIVVKEEQALEIEEKIIDDITKDRNKGDESF